MSSADGTPVDGLGAVADISQIGLDAAAAVVDRLLRATRSGMGWPPGGVGGAGGEGANGGAGQGGPDQGGNRRVADRAGQIRRLRADADRVVDLYGELTRALLDGALDLVDGADTTAQDLLVLGPVSAGTETAAELWLHLLDGPAGPDARLRATDLTAHDGSVIPAKRLTFDPPVVGTAALRSSIRIAVRVDVPAVTPPAPYLGHVLAAGLPELSMPIRVDVVPGR